MHAEISFIGVCFPEARLTNERLCEEFPDWTPEKIFEKTGIRQRPVAAPGECASDLGVRACEEALAHAAVPRSEIDFLLLCTQSPDYILPTTACLMQDRLGLPSSCGALDFNLGCSGFVYGLGLAKGLIESGQARNVLLVTAETYSKHIHPKDKAARAIFGDAAAATLLSAAERPSRNRVGPLLYGTDGSGARALMIPRGGARAARAAPSAEAAEAMDEAGGVRSPDHLQMAGPDIFNFTIREIPKAVRGLLEKAGLAQEAVGHFIFHQANRYMLEHLRRKLAIPEERFPISMADIGNTVSATIPIALRERLGPSCALDAPAMLVGFGVGLSWAAALLVPPGGGPAAGGEAPRP